MSVVGDIFSEMGVEVDPEKFIVIQETPIPRNTTFLQILLCIAGYYRQLERVFAKISACLCSKILKKVHFRWNQEMED